MRIGICDDTAQDRTKVHNWLRMNHPEIPESCVYEFISGEAVIDFLNTNYLDVLFLDCRMCGINCIECASRIKKKDKKIKIVAITDYEKFAPFGYDAEIYRFILKKDFDKRIGDVFGKILHEHNLLNEKTYCAKTDKGMVRLLVSGIVYIESMLRKKNIVMNDGAIYEVYGKMMEFMLFFEPLGFVRPHNSFLVNSIYVHKFSSEQIILISGFIIPISRKYAKDTYDRLMTLLT